MTTSDNPISDKQLAAGVPPGPANAAHSTGPRTPEGKARAAQNSRKHGFTATAFPVIRLEDIQAVANLKADLVAVYQPVNSQELFAIERIALAQQSLLRAAALETGLFTSCLDLVLTDQGDPIPLLSKELVGDIEVTRLQNRNYCLARGFDRMTYGKSQTWPLFLRYQAQSERNYRRAIEEVPATGAPSGPVAPGATQRVAGTEEFERLKAFHSELPNEPIFDPEPEQNTPTSAPPETDPFPPPEPTSIPIGFVSQNPSAVPQRDSSHHSPPATDHSSPQPAVTAATCIQIGFVPQNPKDPTLDARRPNV